ncbi:MAG: Gfo/Idh/MocA family oxidoreductase [Treponema sp.]|jgi:predicted dehydrogenase|nr:Gfo/Idh/MocA family oxidoreductase [Treponema sp.]
MISVAIIGCGGIAPAHISGYLQFPDRCGITRLVDIVVEKADNFKKQFKLDAATVHASHKEILHDPHVDLVSIATPPFTHAEIAIDFLKAGKNVIVEKPMAASLAECDAIIEAAKQGGGVLSVIAQNRFKDPIAKVKNVLDSGKIGRITHAQIDSHWWRGPSYYHLWWRGVWDKEGGGCTLNHAVHHIDMLGWIMGRPESVSAVISNAAHNNSEVEDISVAVMQYGGGALAQVTSSVIHHGEEQQIIFQGEKARVSAPWKVRASQERPNGFPVEDTQFADELENYYQSLSGLAYEGHTGQIDNVLSAIEQGGKPLIGGEDGRLTIELITAIYKSGIERRSVDLPLAKDDPFYTTDGILKNAPRFYPKAVSTGELAGAITVGSSNNR